MSTLQFPQGPIIDPQTKELALDWFMFLQQLNNGFTYLVQGMQQQAGFATIMIGSEDSGGNSEDGSSMGGIIPGPKGPQGPPGAMGLFIIGMDGQDGDDAMMFGYAANGISGTMTTASLVGKTMTFTNGVITAFA